MATAANTQSSPRPWTQNFSVRYEVLDSQALKGSKGHITQPPNLSKHYCQMDCFEVVEDGKISVTWVWCKVPQSRVVGIDEIFHPEGTSRTGSIVSCRFTRDFPLGEGESFAFQTVRQTAEK